jgi:hypothetical protein
MDLIGTFLFYSFLLFLFYKPIQNGNRCHFIIFFRNNFMTTMENSPDRPKDPPREQSYKNQKSISESITFVIFVPFRQIGVLSLW